MRKSEALPRWEPRDARDIEHLIQWTLEQLRKPPNFEPDLRTFSHDDYLKIRRQLPHLFEVNEAIDSGDEAAFIKMMKKPKHALFAFGLLQDAKTPSKQKGGRPRNFMPQLGSMFLGAVNSIWETHYGTSKRKGLRPTAAQVAAMYVNETFPNLGKTTEGRILSYRRSVGRPKGAHIKRPVTSRNPR